MQIIGYTNAVVNMVAGVINVNATYQLEMAVAKRLIAIEDKVAIEI